MEGTIDVILTSCGRWGLLEQTIQAILSVNTHPVRLLVYEDGLNENESEFFALCEKYRVDWVGWSVEREGQIKALDALMKEVRSEYFISAENDWVCVKDDFVQPAIDLMESDPAIHCTWLRGLDKRAMNYQPYEMKEGYAELTKNFMWHGFSFGASIKRLSHYKMIGSYGQHAEFDFKQPWKSEWTIDQLYSKKGFHAASLPGQHFVHIGTETTK